MNVAIASLITVLAPTLWVATILGFPGNWGLLIVAALLSYFAPTSAHIDIETPTILSILAVVVAGEIAEFVAGAAGAKQSGGSKEGTVLAIVGSLVGSIVGIFIGLPVPLVGSLIAALLFGGLGAFGGAVLGERWIGKDWDHSIRIGWGALWGKLLGTLLKTICGTAIMVLIIYAVWF